MYCYLYYGNIPTDFTHIQQTSFTDNGTITRLAQCHGSNPEEYVQISQMDQLIIDNTAPIKQGTANR